MNLRLSSTPRFTPKASSAHPRWIALVAALIALAVAAPSPALARGGGGGGGSNEVRAAGSCGKGASSNLKLKADDGAIEVEFEVEHARSGATWHVVIVREGRVSWRGNARTRFSRFAVTRRLSDYAGADRVMARAVGPRGVTCVATATLPG